MTLSVVKTLGLAVATSVAMATGAIAATFSFEGTYSDGGGVQYFDFNVIEEPAEITIRTFEYSMGTSGRVRDEAQDILSVVTLFDSVGTVVGSNDPNVMVDPNLVQGELGQSPLVLGPLSLGRYTVAMEISEFMQNLDDTMILGALICANEIECQTEVAVRTADWAVDLETTDGEISAVPLPAGLPLLAAGLVGFGVLRRRQKS